jgi:hypothetical protein
MRIVPCRLGRQRTPLQCGLQYNALMLNRVDGFLSFRWGAAARLAESLHAKRSLFGWLSPAENTSGIKSYA